MKKLTLYCFLVLMLCNVGITEEQNILGTSWKITESDGDIKLVKFKKGNSCSYSNIKSYSGNEGKIYDNCEWAQNGNAIVFHMNNYFIIRTAIIYGATMEGYFVSSYNDGVKGTFIGTKN